MVHVYWCGESLPLFAYCVIFLAKGSTLYKQGQYPLANWAQLKREAGREEEDLNTYLSSFFYSSFTALFSLESSLVSSRHRWSELKMVASSVVLLRRIGLALHARIHPAFSLFKVDLELCLVPIWSNWTGIGSVGYLVISWWNSNHG